MPKVYTPLNLTSLVENVQWGQSWYWDIRFDTAPAPFNEWFPAYEVDRSFASVNSFDFQGGNGAFKVPSGFGMRDVQLSFYDNDQATLETWLDEWVNGQIHNDLYSVRTLSEIARTVYIAQLSSTRSLVRTHECMVYPQGDIKSLRNSQAGGAMLLVNFALVGYRHY